jgi:SNF2 family DNA or RNA helicase
VEVKVVGCLFECGEKVGSPTNNREVMEMFRLFNLNADIKLNAFQSFQAITYALADDFSIRVQVKGAQLPTEAVQAIIQSSYCIFNYNLYFFDLETVEELKVITNHSNLSASIIALKRAGKRGLTDSEIEKFSTHQSKQNLGDPNVYLTIDLYPYQKAGLDWLKNRYSVRQGALLADDMGLGKTAQVIAFIAHGIQTGKVSSALIVVPNSLIANWKNEFKKFTKGITPYVHWGAFRSGFSQILKSEKIVISTYSTVANDLGLFKHLRFDLLVLDEASLLKNPDSIRTKALTQLQFGAAIAVTGTPFENSMMDLWSITNVIWKNYLGTRENFAATYVKNNLSQLRAEELVEVETSLKPIILRRMKEDVLTELPPRLDIYKPLSMGDHEQVTYKRIETSIKNSKFNQTYAFSLISDFRKYSAHPLLYSNTIENASFEDLREASSKFEYLDSLLNQISNKKEKAIIFANHIILLNSFKEIFKKNYGWSTYKIDGTVPVEERQEIIDTFSNSQGPAFLFLNPVTAGMGLNITSANHVIHYSRQWNPALEEQASARAYRNGQVRSVNIYYLYYESSIEETIHNRIFLKQEVASNLIKASNEYQSEDQMIFELLTDTKGGYDNEQ